MSAAAQPVAILKGERTAADRGLGPIPRDRDLL